MFKQQLLFYPMSLSHYDALFDYLDLSPIKELTPATGRKPFSRQAICRSLIYGNTMLDAVHYNVSGNLLMKHRKVVLEEPHIIYP